MAPEYPVVSSSNETSSSFAGIIEAFNDLRNRNGQAARAYPASYQGIIAAIADLNRWSNTEGGPLPPGWEIETDGDGNIIDGGWNTIPADGTLWFDTRQGRLFIWIEDDFYQTNGGDGLPYVSETSPGDVPIGQLWWVPSTGDLYIYDGSNWTTLGGGAGGVSTATLPLSNPTRNALQSRSLLPDTIGLTTQSDLNKWIGDSLNALEVAIEESSSDAEIAVGTEAPAGEEGNLWYDTNRLELKIFFDDFWVPTSLPLTQNPDFGSLTDTVADNYVDTTSRITTALQRIHALESKPLRNLQFGVDVNEKGYSFSDSEGQTKVLKLEADGGLTITADSEGLTVNGSALHNAIIDLQQHSADQADVNTIENRTTALETALVNVQSEPRVAVSAFTTLQNIVSGLPTASDLVDFLSANNAKFTNHVDMGTYRLTNMAEPSISSDGATRNYVDALRTYVQANYVNRVDSNFRNLVINRSDITKPGIDFSSSKLASQDALKFNSGDMFVTFGLTNNPHEMAWQFACDERFNWSGPEGVTASIDRTGATFKQLAIGDVLETTSGCTVLNKIDVKERLTKYQTALEGVRSALNSATSFDEFKASAQTALSNI